MDLAEIDSILVGVLLGAFAISRTLQFVNGRSLSAAMTLTKPESLVLSFSVVIFSGASAYRAGWTFNGFAAALLSLFLAIATTRELIRFLKPQPSAETPDSKSDSNPESITTGRRPEVDAIPLITWGLMFALPTVYIADYLLCRGLLGLEAFSTATNIISMLAGAVAGYGGAKIAVRRARTSAISDDDSPVERPPDAP